MLKDVSLPLRPADRAAPREPVAQQRAGFSQLERWRGYRLSPTVPARDKAMLALQIRRQGEVRQVFIPNDAAVHFLVPPRPGADKVEIGGPDLRLDRLGLAGSALAWLTGALTRKDKYRLSWPGLALVMSGPTRSRRRLGAAARFLAENGLRLDGANALDHPELFLGFDRCPVLFAPHTAPRPAPQNIAVVLHLYYAELWPEIEAALRAQPYAFDLIVTHAGAAPDLETRIRAHFPLARIRRLENRGRDIYPFLVLIEDGTLDPYDLVCKIHGKRSVKAAAMIGEVWRRRMMLDLLAGEGMVARVLDRFAAEPALGLLGPARFRKRGCPVGDEGWRAASKSPRHIFAMLGDDAPSGDADFFAGTMFWVRPAALAALKPHGFSAQFEPEAGGVYDGLEVAFETSFNRIVKSAGYLVGEIDYDNRDRL